ncbi:hypothetical protein TcasGA2_TC010134 [Tribolium castaneum]|uniref:Uncharacterized protein n=1 Tax=Tribolium castaneum TaxID=7070 RepID=D6WSQ5_TRICA|nr:hypothetical protein TcasGA2_TC010134 [Tribolium castaneum]
MFTFDYGGIGEGEPFVRFGISRTRDKSQECINKLKNASLVVAASIRSHAIHELSSSVKDRATCITCNPYDPRHDNCSALARAACHLSARTAKLVVDTHRKHRDSFMKILILWKRDTAACSFPHTSLNFSRLCRSEKMRSFIFYEMDTRTISTTLCTHKEST